MTRHLAIVAAAALTLGGVSVTWAQDKDLSDKTKDAAQDVRAKTAETVGIGSADQASQEQTKHAEAIHDVMAQVAEAAMTKTGLGDISERLVDADRKRLGENKDALKTDDAWQNQVKGIEDAWKAKYGGEFDIKDEDKVYNLAFAQIKEGEEGGARTAGATISGGVNSDTGTAKVDVDNKTGVDKPNTPAADANRNDPGRNIATVHIAASHGLPALDVPFIHEAGGWKIDLPDSVDANKFRSNIQAALNDISTKQADWPADKDDGFRFVTHRVLAALLDKAPGAGGAAQ